MKTQKGFAVLESLLIVVVIVVIGGVGWYAIHTKHQTDKILNQADKISQSTPVKAQSPTTNSNSNPTQKYLTIKEWGVRIPYSNGDTYTYKDPTGEGKIVDVISKNLSDQYGCSTLGAGEIRRLSPTDGSYEDGSGPPVSQDAKQYPKDYKYVNGFYYHFSHDQSLCSANQSSGATEAQNQANIAIATLLAKLEPIPQS